MKNNKKYSKRINVLTDLIPDNSNLADVGCDHGYLIINALNQHKINKAIAIDNKIGPLESAKNNISSIDPNNLVRYSLSSGINDIDHDTNVIVIAGMGGLLINSILEEGLNKNKINNEQLFIIEANRNCPDVREFLMNNCFEIINELIIKDSNKFYEIIICKKNSFKTAIGEDEILFGPFLLKEKSDVFIEKYQEELNKLLKININNSQNQILNRIERIKKVCL